MKLLILAITLLFTSSVWAQQKGTAMASFRLHSKKDINDIVKKIGNKRIVAIGEDTHGTKEYYEIRAAVTKKLMTEKGFNVFILENPFEDMKALQNSLYTEPLDTLMSRHLFSIYQTREMKAFLSWLKKYSRNHAIKLSGCDDSYREILPALLKKEIAEYGDTVLNNLALDFEQRQLMEGIEEYYQLPGKIKPDSLPDDIHFGNDTYTVLTKMDSLYQLKNKRNENLEELLFQAKTNYDIYWGMLNKKYLSRDAAMGSRINFYAANKNAKIIIWANSAHIVKKSLNIEIGKMGETIALKNPGEYFALGLCSSKGNYSYLNNNFINDDHIFNDSLLNRDFEPIKENSWNAVFEQEKQVNFSLSFENADQAEIDLYSKAKPFRFIGYRKENPSKVYYNTDPYSKFDLLIFIRNTNHTRALF